MRFYVARFVALFLVIAIGITSFSFDTYAAPRNPGKKSQPERQERKEKEVKCEEFNGFEVRESGIYFQNLKQLGIAISPRDILERALRDLGCVLHNGAGKWRGIVTIGISVRDRSPDGFPVCADTVNVILLWSRRNLNAESFFTASLGDAPGPEEAIQKIVAQSIQDLRKAIARERKKPDPIARTKEVRYY